MSYQGKSNPIQIQGRSPEEIKIYEEKKRKEEKLLNKTAAIKQKKHYDVRVESLVPSTITYRVWADDEQDALNQIKRQAPINVKPHLNQKKDIKASVYDAGSSLLRFMKAFRV